MGGACILPCTLETGCAVVSSAVGIGSKIYQINKLRKKRANSVPNKILLPPIIHKKRLRNNTE